MQLHISGTQPLYKRSVIFSQFVAVFLFFFFNDTATTEIYTLSLHDALPISQLFRNEIERAPGAQAGGHKGAAPQRALVRSEEHTSELQSQSNLVCRLLLEKKKKKKKMKGQ